MIADNLTPEQQSALAELRHRHPPGFEVGTWNAGDAAIMGVLAAFPKPKPERPLFYISRNLDTGAWVIYERRSTMSVAVFKAHHPNPKGAACAEADRLNARER